MELFETYQVEGFLDFVMQLFEVVPMGFLLGAFIGLASYGVFSLIRLFKSLIGR